MLVMCNMECNVNNILSRSNWKIKKIIGADTHNYMWRRLKNHKFENWIKLIEKIHKIYKHSLWKKKVFNIQSFMMYFSTVATNNKITAIYISYLNEHQDTTNF